MKPIAVVLILAFAAAVCLFTAPVPFASERSETGQSRFFRHVLVIDPGHGGEDGGAVAPDGTLEKDLNLAYAARIALLCRWFGVPFVETRNTDAALSDPSLKTVRARKTDDLMKRYRLVNETENALLLSVHQNLYPAGKASGTQIFYAGGVPASEEAAEAIRAAVVSMLQPENSRACKASGSSIYLLYKARRPSVLVECGFLSDPQELNKLKTADYQAALSYAVFRGVFDHIKHQTEERGPAG